MKLRLPGLFFVCLVIGGMAPSADEGMWTFGNPPLKQWKDRYNFTPTQAWLDHVRLASVRLNDGGSGGFVSANGLIVTNQHVAAGQLQKLSTADRDLTRDGFYAPTRDAELKCPDLEVNVLVSFEEVTARIRSASKPDASRSDASARRRAEMAAVERESMATTGLRSEVVTLYNGGEYWLYRFKKYTDVRLVFAVEEAVAFFGGDEDNFTYPRHDLDVAFFRAYENGQPARTPDHFKWASKPPAEGDLVVLSGNPGSTSRLLTRAQIEYHRATGNPLQMQVWSARAAALARYAQGSPEAARRAASARRSLANSMKRLVGQQEGLNNPRIIGRKDAEEKALCDAVAKNPEWRRLYGDAWDQIAEAYAAYPPMAKRIAFSTISHSKLGSHASTIVRYAEQVEKPNDARDEEFRDSRLESLRFTLLSPATLHRDMEEAILAGWLEEAQKALGADDPFVRAALNGRTPAEAARAAIGGTALMDVAARKALLDGGARAVAASSDPLIDLARRVEPAIRELKTWNEENVLNVETAAGSRIAEARFAVYGRTVSPDANFTLRLSYGAVLGYEEDTTRVPFKTTFYGLYDRAEGFEYKEPYNLPKRWTEKKPIVDLATPLNFVYSADTIGGNSGSPIVNRDAEFVGINFDSNLQKLANRYLYIDEREGSRAVGVHAHGILEALRKVYRADALVQEIAGPS
jgi:hypothetical protein